ncbi:unnamed protein product [Allacma fusca]|uniref:Uncharacterized protein n=1 Tax=Allacma fusca TaxID=39272 RepID=A0A8J2JE11_9HEXA|nr:unnamed protein product [Allacma fusca]
MKSKSSMDISNEYLTTVVKEVEEHCIKFYRETLSSFLKKTRTLEEMKKESVDLQVETLNLFCILLHEKGQILEDTLRSELESRLEFRLKHSWQELVTDRVDSDSTGQKESITEINILENYIRNKYSIEVEQLDEEGNSQTIVYEWSTWQLESTEKELMDNSKSKL